MDNQYRVIACLILAAALAVAGCQEQETEKAPVVGADSVITAASGGGASAKALGSTGGGTAWTRAEQIGLDCVATYYGADGGYYLTEHLIMVGPSTNAVVIGGKEPQDTFLWELRNGLFTTMSGAEALDVSGRQVSERDFAEAVLMITTAPVRMLDSHARFARRDNTLKFEGKWYELLDRTVVIDPEQEEEEQFKPYWSKATFYQRTDTGVVDTIRLIGGAGNSLLMVRGYGYSPTSSCGVLVPSKIEIFSTDARGDLKQRLAKIDIK